MAQLTRSRSCRTGGRPCLWSCCLRTCAANYRERRRAPPLACCVAAAARLPLGPFPVPPPGLSERAGLAAGGRPPKRPPGSRSCRTGWKALSLVVLLRPAPPTIGRGGWVRGSRVRSGAGSAGRRSRAPPLACCVAAAARLPLGPFPRSRSCRTDGRPCLWSCCLRACAANYRERRLGAGFAVSERAAGGAGSAGRRSRAPPLACCVAAAARLPLGPFPNRGWLGLPPIGPWRPLGPRAAAWDSGVALPHPRRGVAPAGRTGEGGPWRGRVWLRACADNDRGTASAAGGRAASPASFAVGPGGGLARAVRGPPAAGQALGGAWLPGPSEGCLPWPPGPSGPCPRSSPASPAPVPESGAGFGGGLAAGAVGGAAFPGPRAERPLPRGRVG
ncbi:hypothetical protein C7M84_018128 [Penaeus vannamei]|uniref:Uncharacterized protein n=1 Tax=Penaeus vannamei TaxID=6689 RepID=A0A3R7QDB6_PENVA|nr:hypothetical protein C7M84_018128 [Penaeus vannamei]